MTQGKRLLWIDIAKGFCMLSIIAGHMGLSIVNKIVFPYHLAVFFIISGYTLKNDFSIQYIRRKFSSLMTPYFITCLALMGGAVAKMFVWGYTSISDITAVVRDYILYSFMASGAITTFAGIDIGGRIGVIWFLPALFFAIVTVLLLLKVSNKSLRYVLCLSLALIAYISAKFIWLPFSIQSGLAAAPFVLLGYQCRQNQWLTNLSCKRVLPCFFIWGTTFLLNTSVVTFVTANMPDLLLSSLCALSSSLCIIFLSQKLTKARFLPWIGRNSIWFLCIHLFELEHCGFIYSYCIDKLGFSYYPTVFVLKILLITSATLILQQAMRLLYRIPRSSQTTPPRDPALDAAKAVLIILMIVSHFDINLGLRTILFSCHMPAFIFFSGYCFKSSAAQSLPSSIRRMVKSLLVPYCIYAFLYLLTHHDGTLQELKVLVMGISFGNVCFTDYASICPVYFVLLLFLTRLIYLALTRLFPDERIKTTIILLLSLLGKILGDLGWWLPWSLDIALYALMVYHLGHWFKKYALGDQLYKRNYSYFVLSTIWAFAIYQGGLEYAVRNYGNDYLVALLGSICGSVLLYLLCRFLCSHCSWLTKPLTLIGQNTVWILILHTLWSSHVNFQVAQYLTSGNIPHLLVSTCLQVALGTLAGMLISPRLNRIFKRL